jgi:hypothetical protein
MEREVRTTNNYLMPDKIFDKEIASFEMAIVKANIDKDGVMRWRSVNSDIEEDVYGERMSRELFQDFIQHIENNEPIPAPFDSVIAEPDWNGGMPYISLAHYKSGAGRVNVPGEPSKIYLDGDALKSKGILYDSPLGRAVYKSLSKDLVEKREDKIRISIGFLDLEHSHGDKYTFTRKSLTDKCPLCKEGVGDKIYKKGHLVHLALTRVPANPRTDMEVEKSMTTKREDAESIIEDEEVLKGLDLKSQADDVLVIKSEEEAPVENTGVSPDTVGVVVTDKSGVNTVSSTTYIGTPDGAKAVVIPIPETYTVTGIPEPTPLEKSLAALTGKVAVLKSQGLVGDEALQQIQSDYEEIGNVIRSEFTPKPTPEQIANQNLEATLRSFKSELLAELSQVVAQTVAPIQSEMSELRALSLVSKSVPQIKKEESVPQPRSLTLTQKSAIEGVQQKVSQFDLIAQRSVGLQ